MAAIPFAKWTSSVDVHKTGCFMNIKSVLAINFNAGLRKYMLEQHKTGFNEEVLAAAYAPLLGAEA